MNKYEIVGIVASAIILISFMFKNQMKLRSINIVGSIVFIAYGVLINAWSAVAMNAIMIVVHLVYIVKQWRVK